MGLLALILRVALLPVEPIPEPGVHDEFSYLLMGDTFAHGRLANPTHPMWIHFETFHINQKPRYVSMYYPAQGMFLALGQVLFGHPFWGVWLSAGAMCAAICWMLQGWLPPIWALTGGLLAVIRLGTFSYWANSYWGGAAAAIGGALVLGSFPRIKRRCRARDSALMGLGLVILANSRPYEGLFFSAPILIALIGLLVKKNFPSGVVWRRIVLPLSLLLGLGAGFTLYYFWRTTGDPFLSPYSVNMRTYISVPVFLWGKLGRVVEYHHAEMQAFYMGWCLSEYSFAHSHPILLTMVKAAFLWIFFMGTVFMLPLLALAFMPRYEISYTDMSPRIRMLLLIVLCTITGLLLPVYIGVHYAAPMTGAIYLLVLLAMQRVRRWKWHGQRTGLAIARSTVAVCVLLLVLRAGALAVHIPLSSAMLKTWCAREIELTGRTGVRAALALQPGNILVIVHYRQSHDPGREWVFNEADIDRSKIVWARDMGVEKNQELLQYFKDRKVWLVEPDEHPPRLSEYSAVTPGQHQR
ncbi:MAG: hypothetical protein ACRD20_04615 [Terriglobales bacterium]